MTRASKRWGAKYFSSNVKLMLISPKPTTDVAEDHNEDLSAPKTRAARNYFWTPVLASATRLLTSWAIVADPPFLLRAYEEASMLTLHTSTQLTFESPCSRLRAQAASLHSFCCLSSVCKWNRWRAMRQTTFWGHASPNSGSLKWRPRLTFRRRHAIQPPSNLSSRFSTQLSLFLATR